jgi:hypothetical protein
VEREAPAWIELFPGGTWHAVVKSPDGSRRTLPTMDFDTLLSILDSIQGPELGLVEVIPSA